MLRWNRETAHENKSILYEGHNFRSFSSYHLPKGKDSRKMLFSFTHILIYIFDLFFLKENIPLFSFDENTYKYGLKTRDCNEA